MSKSQYSLKTFVGFIQALLIAIVCLITLPAIADQETKSAKIRELMAENGFMDLIAQEEAALDIYIKQSQQQFIEQIKNDFNFADPELLKAWENEYQKLITATRRSWSSEDLVAKFLDLYGSRMTEAEIDQIIAFEKSPVGRKSAAVVGEITPIWMASFSNSDRNRFKEALQNFATAIKQIIAERKKQSNSQE